MLSVVLRDVLARSQSNMACRGEGCTKFGIFGYLDRKGYWCKQHSTEDMVNRRIYGICRHGGCTKRATFGRPGTRTAISCLAHRQPWEIDVANRMCIAPGCTTQPSYGPAGTRVRCAIHALSTDERWERGRDKEANHPRRPRGRPRKVPLEQPVVRRPRGRPRKKPMTKPVTEQASVDLLPSPTQTDEVWRLVSEAYEVFGESYTPHETQSISGLTEDSLDDMSSQHSTTTSLSSSSSTCDDSLDHCEMWQEYDDPLIHCGDDYYDGLWSRHDALGY